MSWWLLLIQLIRLKTCPWLPLLGYLEIKSDVDNQTTGNTLTLRTLFVMCKALPQNKEQLTFWANSVFSIIVKSTLSALIWYQNKVNTPTFWDMTFSVWNLEHFLWNCYFEKSAFKVSYSKQNNHTHTHKSENAGFWGENVWKSVKNYTEVVEDRYVKPKKSQNRQMGHFSQLCQLQSPVS